jgi:hypothetical protein
MNRRPRRSSAYITIMNATARAPNTVSIKPVCTPAMRVAGSLPAERACVAGRRHGEQCLAHLRAPAWWGQTNSTCAQVDSIDKHLLNRYM